MMRRRSGNSLRSGARLLCVAAAPSDQESSESSSSKACRNCRIRAAFAPRSPLPKRDLRQHAPELVTSGCGCTCFMLNSCTSGNRSTCGEILFQAHYMPTGQGEDRTRTGQEPGVTQIDDRWVQTQGTDLERMSTVVAESPSGVRRMMKSSCVLHSWVSCNTAA